MGCEWLHCKWEYERKGDTFLSVMKMVSCDKPCEAGGPYCAEHDALLCESTANIRMNYSSPDPPRPTND